MDVSSITNKSLDKIAKDRVVENPMGKLDKDAFLKLFLTELQYQDPTQPMDNEKILTQTSQLTQLEAQEEQKKAMKSIMENFDKSTAAQTQFSLIPSIGRMAETSNNALAVKGDGAVEFELFFQKPIKTGSVTIKNERNEIVKTIPLEEYVNPSTGNKYINASGPLEFKWDGKNFKGEFAEKGSYKVTANYIDNIEGEYKTHNSELGTMPISSVRFEDGKTLVKLGGKYVDYKTIKEIK